MELANQEMLATIADAARRSGRRATRSRRTESVPAEPVDTAPAVRRAPRRCTCGVCPACTDNDRWERIFREKFADPEYYSPPFRRGSSLGE